MWSKVVKSQSQIRVPEPLRLAPPDPRQAATDAALDKVAAEAKAAAEKCLAQAQAEAEALREAARREGHEEGYREGYAAGLKAAESVRAALEAAIAAPLQHLRAVQDAAQLVRDHAVLYAARRLAEHCLPAAMGERPEWWGPYLEAAARELAGEPARLLLAPEWQEQVAVMTAALERLGLRVAVELDAALSPDGIALEDADGARVWAGFAAVLERAVDEVLYGDGD
ncbi:MAG: hypothetical protein K6U14_06595 [Firmicutes bacterium]|nr:hypothetical protein [Alicyclobacillaceae bacterium]MCL6497289.1 hypothetical protein [Bacillota bacterium]